MSSKNIAAIDLGTNSFHLIVVKVNEKGNFEIIDRVKEVIRLGEGSSGDIKFILPEAQDRAVNTLKAFKGIADSHNAELRAIATSAVREAQNGKEFVQRVYNECAVNIEVVSGTEEARLIYLGILKAVPIYDVTSLSIDIGGGSVEFIVGKEGGILYSKSIKLGAVRLTQKFFPDYVVTKERIDKCRSWVKGEIYPVWQRINEYSVKLSVGSSGTIIAIGNMILGELYGEKTSNYDINNYVIKSEDLKKIETIVLSKKDIEKRKKIKGLDSKRADIIPAGVIILSTIFDLFGIDKMTVSDYALREGVIVDSMRKYESEEFERHKLKNIRRNSINHLADTFIYDRAHCDHVASLALQLYDQLQPIHKLEDSSREYLEAAAILHDIGHHISHEQHHKHTVYIIQNSELLGFNEAEKNIIANIARYHRKSHPKKSHAEYNYLNDEQKVKVKKLASILRVADSLDRTHHKNIQNIDVTGFNGQVRLKLQYIHSFPEIELWNLERRKQLFEEVFGKELVVEN
jgi:exopolyphosphatase/guanosine-5'-triphosphate,3'-diphosphate pyrophosphatase